MTASHASYAGHDTAACALRYSSWYRTGQCRYLGVISTYVCCVIRRYFMTTVMSVKAWHSINGITRLICRPPHCCVCATLLLLVPDRAVPRLWRHSTLSWSSSRCSLRSPGTRPTPTKWASWPLCTSTCCRRGMRSCSVLRAARKGSRGEL